MNNTTINFYKYQACGNDFVLVDNRQKNIQLTQPQIEQICHRQFGIGADGLMLLQLATGYDFEMVYYNSDGNIGSMCGNGGRAITQFAHDMGIVKSDYLFIASDGPHEAIMQTNGWIHLKMKDINEVEKRTDAFVLNTGSPHYVKPVQQALQLDVVAEGKAIRYNNEFAQQGINVNFVQKIDNQNLYVCTYERGVENETLSCGTGVTACALTHSYTLGQNTLQIKTKGGNLAVNYNKINDTTFNNIWLCGPATFVFKGSINV